MKIVPITLKQAKAFINRHHRHNIASIQSIFNIGLSEGGKIIGVAMAGLPKARLLMDGFTLEITRVCVLENHRNANSMLYGACIRAAKALGWQRVITYTLQSESGSSLKAVGWTIDAESCANVDGWLKANGNHRGAKDMFGNERIPSGPKYRWELRF